MLEHRFDLTSPCTHPFPLILASQHLIVCRCAFTILFSVGTVLCLVASVIVVEIKSSSIHIGERLLVAPDCLLLAYWSHIDSCSPSCPGVLDCLVGMEPVGLSIGPVLPGVISGYLLPASRTPLRLLLDHLVPDCPHCLRKRQ